MKKITKKDFIISAVILQVLAIGFAFLASWFCVRYVQKQKTFVNIMAEVVAYDAKMGIWSLGRGFDEDDTYVPIVEYEVEGKTYTEPLGSYQYPPRYRLGALVPIKYNPNDPTEIFDQLDISFIWLYVGSLVLFVVGIVLFVKSKKMPNKNTE